MAAFGVQQVVEDFAIVELAVKGDTTACQRIHLRLDAVASLGLRAVFKYCPELLRRSFLHALGICQPESFTVQDDGNVGDSFYFL